MYYGLTKIYVSIQAHQLATRNKLPNPFKKSETMGKGCFNACVKRNEEVVHSLAYSYDNRVGRTKTGSKNQKLRLKVRSAFKRTLTIFPR